jgi:hypothetical protein
MPLQVHETVASLTLMGVVTESIDNRPSAGQRGLRISVFIEVGKIAKLRVCLRASSQISLIIRREPFWKRSVRTAVLGAW